MKVIIASDIHGSYYYAKKLVDQFKSINADKLILLGDILYHGPRNDLPKGYAPKEVIELLNGIKDKIICIRGNCDAEVDQMVLDFPIMDDYKILNIDDLKILITHGHLYKDIYPVNDVDIIFEGHTHVPNVEIINGVRHINPGSISIPKNNSKHSYIVIDNSVIEFNTLED